MPLPTPTLRRFGPIAAGFPSPAQGYEDEPLDLNALMIRHPAATFFFRVQGDRHRGDGILDGSILVVDRSVTPSAGRFVIADWHGERQVCRMPAFLDGGQELQVWGTVTGVITRF